MPPLHLGSREPMIQTDPLLDQITSDLTQKHRCHTVLLYGSRANGTAGPSSDYDVMGVRATGKKQRIARKQDGHYLDIFIFPEKDLKKVGEQHLYMKDAVVLREKNKFGSRFVSRVQKLAKAKYKPLPPDEIAALKTWAHKMLERAQKNDIEGNYRRCWLQMALLEDYFLIRKARYWGSKKSFEWLKKNDPETFALFDQALKNPGDLTALESLVKRVTQ